MPAPSPAIVQLLATFARAFTRPTFAHVLVLGYGTILAPGRRTVTAALRAVGLGEERHFTSYHRVLNRAVWSPLSLSRLLLGLLVRTLVPADAPLILLIDGTLERRQGRHIAYKGRFHDAARSRKGQVVTSEGVHWLCVMLAVWLPWSRRAWALPFLSVPTLTPATSATLGKRHRTTVDRADLLVRLVRRWQPDRQMVLVGDSGFAAASLGHTARRQGCLVSRLLLNAQLYDAPPPQPRGKPGPKPTKGRLIMFPFANRERWKVTHERQARTQAHEGPAPAQPGHSPGSGHPHLGGAGGALVWGELVTVALATGTALWHRDGEAPLPLRWVLVRHPRLRAPIARFCTDPDVPAEQILAWYVLRWSIEVTFQEARAPLGLETQRQWSTPAIGRATPCLLGLFSLVVLLAHRLQPQNLATRQTAWYAKTEPTFCDVLARVRRHLWTSRNRPTPTAPRDSANSSDLLLDALIEAACYAA